jgi:hypothetical protein
VAEHEVEDHDLVRDERRACPAPVPVVALANRAVDAGVVEVVHVTAVGPEPAPPGQPAGDQPVEEVANVGAVPESGELHVLAPQAEAAVERDRDHEAGLALAEAQRLDGADAFVEGHASH